MIVAATIAAGFTAVLLWHEHLPARRRVRALALLSAGTARCSTRSSTATPRRGRRVNTALASVPLGLVVRFDDYRRTHLAHHATPDLTDPAVDPESFYVTAERWGRTGPLGRALLLACSTLAGRLVLGPLVVSARLVWR